MSHFTRRHWGRELLSALLFPLSMFTHRKAQPDGKLGARELDPQAVILGIFVWDFHKHFPTEPAQWNVWAWAALATLTFALIIETLFAAVPVREGLAALVSVFGAIAGRAVTAAGGAVVTTSTTVETGPTPPEVAP